MEKFIYKLLITEDKKYDIILSKRKMKKVVNAVFTMLKNKKHKELYFDSIKDFYYFIFKIQENTHPVYWNGILHVFSCIKFIKCDNKIHVWYKPNIDYIVDTYYKDRKFIINIVSENLIDETELHLYN